MISIYINERDINIVKGKATDHGVRIKQTAHIGVGDNEALFAALKRMRASKANIAFVADSYYTVPRVEDVPCVNEETFNYSHEQAKQSVSSGQFVPLEQIMQGIGKKKINRRVSTAAHVTTLPNEVACVIQSVLEHYKCELRYIDAAYDALDDLLFYYAKPIAVDEDKEKIYLPQNFILLCLKGNYVSVSVFLKSKRIENYNVMINLANDDMDMQLAKIARYAVARAKKFGIEAIESIYLAGEIVAAEAKARLISTATSTTCTLFPLSRVIKIIATDDFAANLLAIGGLLK